MKVYNENHHSSVHPELLNELASYRYWRNFKADEYIEQKTALLNRYMSQCHLDTAVVAISGGIDSALVLALVNEASKREDSPIKKIVPVAMPLYDGVLTNQEDATARARELCDVLCLDLTTVPINGLVSAYIATAETANYQTTPWATGQMGAYARTSFLYYLNSLLNEQGYKPILVGTTNMDEGCYLGYVGKASDGLVDVQLITDIHKSEVYACSQLLGIPESIMTVIPNGDMYDGRVDTEVFGAPYDIVELYLAERQHKITVNVSDDAQAEYDEYKSALDKLHRYNRHKYFALSPAVHLDLWSTETDNGYINYHKRLETILE